MAKGSGRRVHGQQERRDNCHGKLGRKTPLHGRTANTQNTDE
jgi:hypothetical protein